MGNAPREIQEVVRSFEGRFDDPESRAYARLHARRYEILLELVADALARGASPGARVLDVGPSFQTEAIRALHADAVVDSLGFADARFPSPRPGERHVQLDLNGAGDRSLWPRLDPYDVIVCAEVIEHLHVSPAHTLGLLTSLLRPEGRLIVQTPNAAALSRRFWLLMGRNPYEPIREDTVQAGHFREYTVAELLELAAAAGLQVEYVRLENYFRTGSRKNELLLRYGRLLPRRLRQGITLVARPLAGTARPDRRSAPTA